MNHRIDIHGRPLDTTVQTERCGECGMGTVSLAEFHPWRACEVYKETHDSREVWRALYREGLVHELLGVER